MNATQGLGLWYRRDANLILESVSDASFAPGGAIAMSASSRR